MKFIKSAILLIYTLALSLVTFLIGIFDKKGTRHGKMMHHWAQTVLFFAGVKFDVEGLENLEAANPALIVINHESALDIPVAIAALPIDLRFIFKIELLYIPLFGWALWQGEHIAINRSKPKKAIRAINSKSGDIIEKKRNIIIAPEGTRSKDGKIGRFKKGGFKIAERFNLPIISVTMIGNRYCNPKGAFTIVPGTVRVVIDSPKRVSDYANLTACMQAVRNDMIGHKNRLETSVEETFSA